jgi:hypothetical protein
MRYHTQVEVRVVCLAALGFFVFFAFDSRPGYAGLFGEISRAARSLGHIPGGGGGYQQKHHSGQSGGNSNDSDDSDNGSASNQSSNTLVGALKDAKNAAAAVAEYQEMERAKQLERGRNVDLALNEFISLLKDYHKQILHRDVNVEAATGLNINQVTTGELRRGAEDAYKNARLYEFERYAGELWTRDRLLVRIIQQSETGLKPYFEGVGAKGPSMAEINDLFARSAIQVHSKALEISEIVGVSLSFDRFIRAMYENSDRTEGLWARGTNEQADGLYERLATTLIDTQPREMFIQDGAGLASDPLGLERQFQYRFRARRALYDCLTAHYSDFVTKASTGKPIEAAFNEKSAPSAAGSATKGLLPEPAPNSLAAGSTKTADAEPATPTAMSLPGVEDVSMRAQSYISQYCRDSTLSVANLARQGKIEPISTRVDASALPPDGSSGSGGGDAPAVLQPQ